MLGYNFTEDVRVALAMAREEAARLHRGYVGPEHVLLGLIADGATTPDRRDAAARVVLDNLGVVAAELRRLVEQLEARAGGTTGTFGPDLPYTSRAKKVLELAMREARDLRHNYLGTEHILLGLLDQETGIAIEALAEVGVTRERALAETLRVLGDGIPVVESTAGEVAGRHTVIDAEWGRLTDRARRALDVARAEAVRRRAEYVGTEHLLLGLIADHDGAAAAVLDRLGVDHGRVRASVRRGPVALAERRHGDRAAGQSSTTSSPAIGDALPDSLNAPSYSNALRRAVDLAREDARSRAAQVTGSDHLLVGLLREGASLGARLLIAEGVTVQAVLTERERLTG
jgi:ATP-dependent Clp protease ATP-binding subunit ClpA